MSTPLPATPTAVKPVPSEIRLYSHSSIFYWWPVWLVGFLMALLTYFDGGRMVVVPPGTEARRDWPVEVAPGRMENREGLILPPSTGPHAVHLPPSVRSNSSVFPPPEQPHVRMAQSHQLGTWFLGTLFLVFMSSNIPLRGLWEWIGVLAIALVVTLILWLGWWSDVASWVRLLHIQINMAGYLVLSTGLFAIWAVSTFYFDTLTYIVFSAGQVRVCQEIGQGEKIYDVTNLRLELQPNILVRHRILGLYDAGDLIVITGGSHPEVIEWPNVLFVRSRLRRIEHLLHTRELVEERAGNGKPASAELGVS